MQFLFGKILAGEIQRPSSFSLKTLNVVAEMDKEVALLFQKFCSISSFIHLSKIDKIADARLLTLGGNPGSNSLAKYGLHYAHLTKLMDYGLISTNLRSTGEVTICVNAATKRNVIIPFILGGRRLILDPIKPVDFAPSVKVAGIRFTQVGLELSRVVDIIRNEEYEAELIEFFNKNFNMEVVEVSYPLRVFN